MNEIATQTRTEIIKQTVIDMTNEEWQTYGRALMLARLGQALSRKGFDLKTDLKGEKLAAFIARELYDKVQSLTLPSDPLVKGIVPSGVVLEQNLAVYFSRPDVSPRIRTGERVNFDRRVWLAFSRAIQPNCVRTITLEPEIQFNDIASGAEKTDRFSIPAELVVLNSTQSKYEREAMIYSNILQWVSSNGIELDLVKASRMWRNEGGKSEDSVFSILLRALDQNDLQRISIPLDIVEKLQSKKLKSN